MQRYTSSQGFTLYNLIITLAIVGIVFGLAIPNFVVFVKNIQIYTAINSFNASLHLARSEAINRKTDIYICTRDNLDCSGKNDWTTGLLIYQDLNKNQEFDEDELIQATDPFSEYISFSSNGKVDQLKYKNNGRAARKNGALPMMSFLMCDSKHRTNTAYKLTLNASGRITTTKSTKDEIKCE